MLRKVLDNYNQTITSTQIASFMISRQRGDKSTFLKPVEAEF